MNLTDVFGRVRCTDVIVRRDERQRKVVEIDDLIPSIQQFGVLCPIVLDEHGVLVFGERRLTTCLHLGLEDIPYRLVQDLSPVERQMLELEENVKRRGLTWRDEVEACAKIHSLHQQVDPAWSQQETAKLLGVNSGDLSMILRVSREIDSPRLAQASGIRAAYNILARLDDRAMGDAISDIMETGKQIFQEPEIAVSIMTPSTWVPPGDGISVGALHAEPAPPPPPAPDSILNESFLDWAPNYTGRPFTFVHCDFPYGINAFGGEMSGRDKWTTYDDSPDVYWALIRCLCQNLDKIMAHSSHLMFWFSMEHYWETMEAFRIHAPSLHFNKFPLLWLKSDNVGILPDANRGPRRVYETALIASREDRLILKPVGNAYSAPTDKRHHHSTKPEPMLKHFFQMFVDEHTRMLDPTCGGGSALRAADTMGVEQVLGLEISEEHCDNARRAFRQARALRNASKVV
jgi:hypothetical protein